MKTNLRLFLFVVAVSLFTTGNYGFHYVSINFLQNHFESLINSSVVDRYGYALTTHQLHLLYGVMVGLPMLSAVMGCLVAKPLMDHVGRKYAAVGAPNLFFLISAGLTCLPYWTGVFELLHVGRFIFGLAFGIAYIATPVYLSECSPPEARGEVGLISTTFIELGSLLVFVLTLPQFFGTADKWVWVYVGSVFWSLAGVMLVKFIPESPKHEFLTKRDEKKTLDTVQLLQGPQKDFGEIIKGYEAESHQARSNICLKLVWAAPHLRKALLVSIAVSLTKLTTGVPLISVYSKSIYEVQIGMDSYHAMSIIIGNQCLACVTSLISSAFIEKWPRRTAFLVITLLMAICCSVFVILSATYRAILASWLPYAAAVSLVANQMLDNCGPNMISQYFSSEISPQAARGTITSVSVSVQMTARVVYFLIFPLMQSIMREYTVIILMVVPTTVLLIYLYRVMPETRNRPIHEIVEGWMNRSEKKSETFVPLIHTSEEITAIEVKEPPQ